MKDQFKKINLVSAKKDYSELLQLRKESKRLASKIKNIKARISTLEARVE